ncbi:hypothetical protein IGI04_026894 [Brassica rapa subsp. trilocularis]|uniref:Uncharacterized protein n=1 Tax=Brassica rapa subsp. trilocularis TaxID=1813537 RepID=A0ABQ7KXK8_BRACM|nr:hypothetical protein IGI04_026894 [Brassica rapa subsp. trilocularis]
MNSSSPDPLSTTIHLAIGFVAHLSPITATSLGISPYISLISPQSLFSFDIIGFSVDSFEEERCYHLLLLIKLDRLYLSQNPWGWGKFCRDNRCDIGDLFVFNLVGDGKTTPLLCVCPESKECSELLSKHLSRKRGDIASSSQFRLKFLCFSTLYSFQFRLKYL